MVKAGDCCKSSNRCTAPKMALVPRANFQIPLLQCCGAARRIRHRNDTRPAACPAGSIAFTVTAKIHETNLPNNNSRLDGSRARRGGKGSVDPAKNAETAQAASQTRGDQGDS